MPASKAICGIHTTCPLSPLFSPLLQTPDWSPRQTTSPAWSADGSKLYVAYMAAGAGWPNRILVNDNPFATAPQAPAWKPVAAAGLPKDAAVLRMIPHPTNADTMYVANWLGVYVTADGGASFTRLGDTSDNSLPLACTSSHVVERATSCGPARVAGLCLRLTSDRAKIRARLSSRLRYQEHSSRAWEMR
jgi:hypothetical protein